MITYTSNKNKQIPSLVEVRVSCQEKQDKALMLRYKPQYGHACDSMTKYSGHAWYDLMYANEICKRKKGGYFLGYDKRQSFLVDWWLREPL